MHQLPFRAILALLLISTFHGIANAQPAWTGKANYTKLFDAPDESALRSWILHPVYGMPGSGGSVQIPTPAVTPSMDITGTTQPVVFCGLEATQRITLPGGVSDLNLEVFSVELWINDHVSGALGLVLSARTQDSFHPPTWMATYWSEGYINRAMQFGIETKLDGEVTRAIAAYENTEKDGFKEYWRHLVAVFENGQARYYVNGKLCDTVQAPGRLAYPDGTYLELSGHFGDEPYMELGNFLRRVRLHDRALTEREIGSRFAKLCAEVEAGVVFPGEFHFIAGPYISHATTDSVSQVFETDREVTATVHWGTETPLVHAAPIENAGKILDYRITGLAPDTPYFYEVRTKDASGAELSAGLHSFRTAMPVGHPFRFGVIGDTETRPHINQQLGRMIWDERLSFVVNLGDLADGGKEHAKFQWNYEYFVGMIPLASRVPLMTVPGNGESDLYWYKRYHAIPGEKSPYTFTWGDAAFFMLDSNLRKEEFKPGGRQYEWIDKALTASDAKWKFVAMHHAPYTSEENDYGDSWKEKSHLGDLDVRPIVPLLEKHGVDLVMFGHLHLYERTRPLIGGHLNGEGIVYLLSGGGGGNLEDFAPNPAPFTVKTHRGHHYCTVDLSATECIVRMYDIEGDLRDQFTISKASPREL